MRCYDTLFSGARKSTTAKSCKPFLTNILGIMVVGFLGVEKPPELFLVFCLNYCG